ncbi:MAG TPA: FmdB family zinc ribbon protein [Dehalococcoidia bacterium]|nr:FmdB family zinc ribbon protein [Dehalococcoidia bacterium]
MPKYDYRCNDCGHVYEKREGFDAPAVQTCPDCSGSARRLLSIPAIVFKGSGWYVTDSRKGGSNGDSPTTSPSGSSDSKGDSSTSTKDAGKDSGKDSGKDTGAGSSSAGSSSAGSSSKDAGTSKSESPAKT